MKNCFYQFLFLLAATASSLARPVVDSEGVLSDVDANRPGFLATMKEPSLHGLHMDKVTESYRFLWLRTFHKPIAVRIWKNRAGITLRVVRLSGKGGYQPGHIERDESFSLTAAQWDTFLQLLNESAFWEMPVANWDLAVSDGSDWILEGKAAGKYHAVDRVCPLDDIEKRRLSGFVACCRYLLKLAGEAVPKKEDY